MSELADVGNCKLSSQQHRELPQIQTCVMLRAPPAATQHLSLGTLPIEILTNIFSFVLARDHAFVVILAQLSPRLRRIVVSTPLLWSTLSLSSAKDPQAKVQHWLSHNKGLLRGLYLRDYDERVREAIKALSGVSLAHLRAFSIKEHGRGLLQSGLPLLTPTVTSRLHFLSLGTPVRDWFHGAGDLQLRSLNIHVAIYEWTNLATQCVHLCHLIYRGPPTADVVPGILSLIRMNPVLKSVTLSSRTPSRSRRVIPHFELPPLSPPIKLAHLTTLVLGSDTLKTSYIVSSLSTPNLRHLKLAGLCEEWDATIQNLIATNAIGRLETLSIIYRYANVPAEKLSRSDAFIQLLQHASRLKSLELFHVPHIGPVLRALAQAASDVPSTAPVVALCPQLSTLDVSQCPDVNDELLMDIVKARNNNHHTSQAGRLSVSLYKLVINSCEQVSRATLSELKERVPQVICHYDWKQREKHVGQPTQNHDASHW